MNILLIEDDLKLIEHLTTALKENDYSVISTTKIEDLSTLLDDNIKIDFVIMDRMIESIDSKDYLTKIKNKWQAAPILILSAVNTPDERARILDLGADDYMGKPFSTIELIARIKSLSRRYGIGNNNLLTLNNLTIDLMKRTLIVNGQVITLAAKEFLLLKIFAQEPKRVWNKAELLNAIWGHSADTETNVVESTITNLRKKLEELKVKAQIKNLRNSGYWIEA